MKNTKTFKVIMLPTEKVINQPNWYFPATKILVIDRKQQHLYILSDEPAKIGEWKISASKGGTYFIDTYIKNDPCDEAPFENNRKIVATTDTSLTCNGVKREGESCTLNNNCKYPFCNLPQIPELFINAYIKAYNEGKPITEVDLECDWCNPEFKNEGFKPIFNIKTRSDNTVIVHKSKMYSKEEVIQFGLKCLELGMSLGNDPLPRLSNESGKEYYYKWIEENL